MKILKEKELTYFLKQFNFYDFDNLYSINNKDIKIQFSKYIENVTYNDLSFCGNRKIFEQKGKMILALVKCILTQIRDDYCVLTKYHNCWIVNKRKSAQLYRVLKENNVKIKASKALMVHKNDSEMELFLKAILKYNSFIQFLFSYEKIVMTITDHMDIFISSENDGFIQVVQDEVIKFNADYKIKQYYNEVFTIVMNSVE